MTLEMVIIWLLVGLVAGWLASQVVRGGGFPGGYAGLIFVAFIGAALLLLILGLTRRRR